MLFFTGLVKTLFSPKLPFSFFSMRLLFTANVNIMDRKSSIRNAQIRNLFYVSANSICFMSDVSDVEIFLSTNCSKFAAACDLDREISQNVQILGLFEKLWFFSKENLKVFQFAEEGKFNLHCASNDIFSEKILYYLDCEVFRPKIRKISSSGKLETMMKHGSVLKKKAFIVLKGIYTKMEKWEGGKYASGGWPSC